MENKYKEYLTDDVIEEIESTAVLQRQGFDLWDDVGGKVTYRRGGGTTDAYRKRRFKQFNQYQKLMEQMNKRVDAVRSRIFASTAHLPDGDKLAMTILTECEMIHKKNINWRGTSNIAKTPRGWGA